VKGNAPGARVILSRAACPTRVSSGQSLCIGITGHQAGAMRRQ
jgi:hypothetical protein